MLLKGRKRLSLERPIVSIAARSNSVRYCIQDKAIWSEVLIEEEKKTIL